jgi:hypothetical protein
MIHPVPTIRVTFRLTAPELAAIDRARGDVPRNTWMRKALVNHHTVHVRGESQPKEQQS